LEEKHNAIYNSSFPKKGLRIHALAWRAYTKGILNTGIEDTNAMIIEYLKGSRYPDPSEEPPIDSIGLFIEAIPVFKIWYAPPVDFERDCLDSSCSHIGLLPPSLFPGGLPFFLFVNSERKTFMVRAPLAATQEQVNSWASADSNGFIFVLIERGTKIIRQIRTLGVPPNYRRALAKAWLSTTHPINMQKSQTLLANMTEPDIFKAAAVWAYDSEEDNFEPQAR
jgi:hypothetical protein